MSGEWSVVRADIVGLGWDDQYVVRDSDRNVIAGPLTREMAFDIAANHNALAIEANCLRVELESVKEQSLRVLEVGASCALFDLQTNDCHLFRHVTGGPVYIMDTAIKGRSNTDSGRAHWCAKLEGVTKEWAQYDDYAPIQPVRLERWSDQK